MYRFQKKYHLRFISVLSLALILFFVIETFFTENKNRKDQYKMREAVNLSQKWFSDVNYMKKERKIVGDSKSDIKYSSLIGDEFTEVTTTLGSLEAKEISSNPEFAALVVKYLTDCEIDSTKTVGLILSGSFPALSISSLAAIQTLKAGAIIFSSLGSSMYGANQPGATWIDIENYLRNNGNLLYKSFLVTLGAENDNGGGLSTEGIEMLMTAAAKNNVDIYIPRSLSESISKKTDILLQNKIDLLINIGGNQTSLGTCYHSSEIPNGMHKNFKACKDQTRGIIMRLSEKGIPFVNLLNIRNLAVSNGISINPLVNNSGATNKDRKTKKIPAFFSLIVLSLSLLLIRKKTLS